jgi:hypothetical protein
LILLTIAFVEELEIAKDLFASGFKDFLFVLVMGSCMWLKVIAKEPHLSNGRIKHKANKHQLRQFHYQRLFPLFSLSS